MKQNEIKNKTGFTLIELLIVVLIIGILSAIALPMYRKSVEKSRVTDALTTMQAVAKSEHGWYLNNNNYTKDFANLDIDLIDENGEKAEGESYDTVNYTFTLQDNAIKAERTNNEYTLYKMYEDPNIYCLPQEHEICQQFGWGVNKSLCNNINGAWSNKTGQCYNSEQERCTATVDPDDENPATWQTTKNRGNFCGFYGSNFDGIKAGEFQVCHAELFACNYSTFTGEGSICYAHNSNDCNYSHFYQSAECYGRCTQSTFTGGSICYGDYGEWCRNLTINEGSKCISNNTYSCEDIIVNDGGKCVMIDGPATFIRYACKGTYNGTGCCEGSRCPGSTPKCECPIDENTGKHQTSC